MYIIKCCSLLTFINTSLRLSVSSELESPGSHPSQYLHRTGEIPSSLRLASGAGGGGEFWGRK